MFHSFLFPPFIFDCFWVYRYSSFFLFAFSDFILPRTTCWYVGEWDIEVNRFILFRLWSTTSFFKKSIKNLVFVFCLPHCELFLQFTVLCAVLNHQPCCSWHVLATWGRYIEETRSGEDGALIHWCVLNIPYKVKSMWTPPIHVLLLPFTLQLFFLWFWLHAAYFRLFLAAVV